VKSLVPMIFPAILEMKKELEETFEEEIPETETTNNNPI